MNLISDGDKLRDKLKELSEDIRTAGDRRDWDLCDNLDLEYEDTVRELNLLERPNYYSIEK